MAKKVTVRTIPEAVADRLQEEISQGEWGGGLPGYRAMATHFGVGKNSMSEALAILEKRGILSKVERGGRRQVMKKVRVQCKQTKRLLALRWKQYTMEPREHKVWAEMLQNWQASVNGGEVDEVLVDMERTGDLVSRLTKMISSHNSDAVLINVPTEEWVKALIELGIPVYARGGNLGKMMQEVAGASYDIRLALEQVLNELRSRGHIRIMSPVILPSIQYRKAYESAYANVFGDELSQKQISDLCPQFSGEDPEVWKGYWRKHLASQSPTAVVCRAFSELLSLYGFCYEAGIHIPKNLSVVCINEIDLMEWISPKVTILRYPYDREHTRFAKWMKDGKPGFSLYDLEWIEGASVRG